jgi:hypothetical protein
MSFTPPTFLQVSDYAHEIDFPDMDIQYFLDHYTLRNWELNYNGKLFPMKNWKNAVRVWKNKHDKYKAQKEKEFEQVFDWKKILERAISGQAITYFEKQKIPANILIEHVFLENENHLWYLPEKEVSNG